MIRTACCPSAPASSRTFWPRCGSAGALPPPPLGGFGSGVGEPVFQDERIDAHGIEPASDVHALIAHHEISEPAAWCNNHLRPNGSVLVGWVVLQNGADDILYHRHARRGLRFAPVPVLRSGGHPLIQRDLALRWCQLLGERGDREGREKRCDFSGEGDIHLVLLCRAVRCPGCVKIILSVLMRPPNSPDRLTNFRDARIQLDSVV